MVYRSRRKLTSAGFQLVAGFLGFWIFPRGNLHYGPAPLLQLYKPLRLYKETGTTLANKAVASSTGDEKAIAELEVTATKVIPSAAVIIIDRSILPRFPSFSQRLIEKHTGLEFLYSLYAELLF